MATIKHRHEPSDYLSIQQFEVLGQVGITDEERSKAQPLIISIKIFLPLQNAGRNDELKRTLDYAEAIEEIKHLLTTHEYKLVERVAEDIAALILKKPRVTQTEVAVMKKVFPYIHRVGVCITRFNHGPK